MTKVAKPRMPLTEQDKTDYTAALKQAAATRSRIIEGMSRLQKRVEEPDRQPEISKRLRGKGGLVYQYNHEIERLQELLPQDGLLELAQQYEARLEKGWGMSPTDEVVELFARLATEYAVVIDAIEGEALSIWLERVDRWLSYGGQ